MQRRFLPLLLLSTAIGLMACGRHETPVAGNVDGGGAQASPYIQPEGLVSGGLCALDAVDGVPPEEARPRTNATVVFAGWLGDADGGVPERAHLVLVGDAGAFQFVTRAGGHRPDVAAALSQPGLERSGYNTLVNLVGVPAGTYRASILMRDEALMECVLNANISIE